MKIHNEKVVIERGKLIQLWFSTSVRLKGLQTGATVERGQSKEELHQIADDKN